jgi:hypothetical protein
LTLPVINILLHDKRSEIASATNLPPRIHDVAS